MDLINNMLFPNKIHLYVKGYYSKFQSKNRTTTQDSIILQKSKTTPVYYEENGEMNNRSNSNTNISCKDQFDEDDLEIMKNKQYNMIFSYNPQEGTNSKKSINGLFSRSKSISFIIKTQIKNQ